MIKLTITRKDGTMFTEDFGDIERVVYIVTMLDNFGHEYTIKFIEPPTIDHVMETFLMSRGETDVQKLYEMCRL
jgi:hypothetical protein